MNIVRQVLETTIPVKIYDLLETLPQLQVALTQGANLKGTTSKKEKEGEVQTKDNTLFTIGMVRTPAVVEMEILGCKLSNTIIDGGSSINVLSEETWKEIGKPTLWPSTFQLVGADQHGIKSIGTLMGQKVIVGMHQFFLDFVVITLEKKGYDPYSGRGWLVVAKASHN